MNTEIDKIAWLHIVDGRILTARSKGKDTYYLPGGKREPGESDIDTLVREIEEELSVRINRKTAARVDSFHAAAHGKLEGVQVTMTCYTADYEGELNPASEIEALAWFTYKERERVSAVCQMIFDYLHNEKMLAD
ncbi:NUDIX domain-containing protein [Paenibacillus glucanolyticus]|uniref:NUDIX hydrolase n=1 Tax=Paenibacillus glucanolyticus TaxID=59843 RepID=UPI00096DBD38|nr:NUDIX domain-containing protein [Paenibacillus glucanolyticus]OMF80235.1 DNA mismatch repair protein MutT [Paenibacillus glucanolyticus]